METKRFDFSTLKTLKVPYAETAKRLYASYQVAGDNLQKYIFLRDLSNASYDYFFQFASDHLKEFLPIIYTPTVGYAIQNYAELVKEIKGLHITYHKPSDDLVDEEEIIDHHMAYMVPLLKKELCGKGK